MTPESYLYVEYSRIRRLASKEKIPVLSRVAFIDLYRNDAAFLSMHADYEEDGFKAFSPFAPVVRAIDFRLGFVPGNLRMVPFEQRNNPRFVYRPLTKEERGQRRHHEEARKRAVAEETQKAEQRKETPRKGESCPEAVKLTEKIKLKMEEKYGRPF